MRLEHEVLLISEDVCATGRAGPSGAAGQGVFVDGLGEVLSLPEVWGDHVLAPFFAMNFSVSPETSSWRTLSLSFRSVRGKGQNKPGPLHGGLCVFMQLCQGCW